MRIWEIAGAVLVLVGLVVFYQVFAMLVNEQPRLIESGPLTLIGIIVFRGGVHLLKVGAAAQACREWQAEQRAAKNAPPRQLPGPNRP